MSNNILALALVIGIRMATTSAAPLRQLSPDIGQVKPSAAFDTDTIFVHDPVMACEDGIYYLFSTGTNLGRAISKDLKTWTVYRDGLLSSIPAWTHDSVPGFKAHIWAPDIIRWHNRWWLAYSCSTFGRNTSAIGLLTASSLAQADWTDKGCLVASKEGRDNWNAIDPNFVSDDDRLWLTWGSFWDGIQLAPLELANEANAEAGGGVASQTLRLAAQPRTIARRYHNNAPKDLENPTSKYAGVNVIEAPFIFKHGGWYYLFVSWDYCCRGEKSTYRVVVGRSKSVDGPYLDKEGRDMAEGGGSALFEGDKTNFEAAGHCAVYSLSSDCCIFICHGYSIPLQGQSILIQRPLRWEDGWPAVE